MSVMPPAISGLICSTTSPVILFQGTVCLRTRSEYYHINRIAITGYFRYLTSNRYEIMERAPKAAAYLYIFHALYEIFRVIAESITDNVMALIRHFKWIRVERHYQLRMLESLRSFFIVLFF